MAGGGTKTAGEGGWGDLEQDRDNGRVEVGSDGCRLQVHLLLCPHGRLFTCFSLRMVVAGMAAQRVELHHVHRHITSHD